MKKKEKPKADSNICLLQGTMLEKDTKRDAAVETYLQSLGKEPAIPVCVDFSKVTTLSASGIDILLGLQKECRKTERDLSFTGVSAELEELFKSLALTDTFTFNKVK